MWTKCPLKWAMLAAFGSSALCLAQAKPGETIQVGGGVYTVIDRVEFVGRPTGFSKPISHPMPYDPGEMCPPSPHGRPAVDAFGQAEGKPRGLFAAILKVRLLGPPRLGPQNYGGEIEFALMNPCPDPIAVPIVEADALRDDLPKQGRFQAIQVLFMSLAGGDGMDAEYSGGYALAGSRSNDKTYRILKQGEAVVLVAPLEINVNLMPQRELEHALESLRLLSWFGYSDWTADGQLPAPDHYKGWSIVCDHDTVPLAVGKETGRSVP